MCFSATASFTAGAILSTLGIFSIRKTKETSDVPFASIPLLFGAQQITEGFLWLALSNSDFAFMERFSTYAFLIFAQVIWPFWVPFSIFKFNKLKKNRISKIVGIIMIGIGLVIAVSMSYFLYSNPVDSEILNCHISYHQAYPQKYALLGGILYLIATLGPHFTTLNKKMWIIGVSTLTSYIFTEIFYTQYVVSVWCFFAAILSTLILWVVISKKKNNSKSQQD